MSALLTRDFDFRETPGGLVPAPPIVTRLFSLPMAELDGLPPGLSQNVPLGADLQRLRLAGGLLLGSRGLVGCALRPLSPSMAALYFFFPTRMSGTSDRIGIAFSVTSHSFRSGSFLIS